MSGNAGYSTATGAISLRPDAPVVTSLVYDEMVIRISDPIVRAYVAERARAIRDRELDDMIVDALLGGGT